PPGDVRAGPGLAPGARAQRPGPRPPRPAPVRGPLGPGRTLDSTWPSVHDSEVHILHTHHRRSRPLARHMMTIRTRVPTPAVYAAQITAIAAVYFGAAKLGLLAAVAQKVVSSAWPPSGVALAALLLLGLRYWPGIALGAFLLNWTASVPVAGAAGIALGNTLEAVSAVWLLRRVADFRPSLDRFRDVVAL